LLAGLSVAVVLVPQSLAYAELAGVPAHLGLYASAVAPIVAAPFASSRYLQTGPTAMTSLLTLGALSPLALAGGAEYVGLAVLLALLVGAFRIMLGVVRFGSAANFLSRPVILGFTVAAAVLIFASQLPTALGVTVEPGGVGARAWSAVSAPAAWDRRAVGITAASLVVFFGGRRLHRQFPAVMVIALGGLAYSVLAKYDGQTVGTVPPAQLPSLDIPWASTPALLLPAALIALVGFAEPAAIARTFAAMDRTRWDANRAMLCQGVANVAAGLSGGFPVGASFSRSALSRLAGTRTRWSGAITGIAVLLFIPVAGVIAPLPKAVLASIVIASILGLVGRGTELPALWRASRPQAAIGAATFLLTLLLAPHVEYAVMAGVGLSLAVHVWRELSVTVHVQHDERVLTLELNGVLWFASAPFVEERFNAALAGHTETERLVLDLGGLGRIDYTGALALKAVLDDARTAGLKVAVQDVPPQSAGLLRRVCGDAVPLPRE
jgi:SulP family sulfate permease